MSKGAALSKEYQERCLNIQKLIKHTKINFQSILYITYVKDMPNLQTTHTH